MQADYRTEESRILALAELTDTPVVRNEKEQIVSIDAGELKAIYFDALIYEGKQTRVYAWIGIPEDASSSHKVPGIVLIHGGGGTAFKEWVEKWNARGYAAISIAVEGQIDEREPRKPGDTKRNRWKKHPWSGPARAGIYGDSDKPIEEQWMYHSVADAILANSLLRSLSQVDSTRVGLMGISWGGIIASTVIGIDDRFAFAIPTYGCGNLSQAANQYGRALGNNDLYKEVWDPILRLKKVEIPTLWLSWPEDQHFPLDKQASCYRTVSGPYMVCLIPGMKHGHQAGMEPPDSYAFADSVVKEGKPWARQISSETESGQFTVIFESSRPLDEAFLISTADTGITGKRKWFESPAKLERRAAQWVVTAAQPEGTTACFINVKSGGLTLTSDYTEIKQETNTRTATSSTGIDDIDKVRAEVRATPTDASNVLSRRTALYRWWRLFWHQGYDMNMSNYNAIWNRVLSNPGVNAAAQKVVDAAYAAMEDIAVNGTLIPEVPGKPDESGPITETDWPVYHGTDGNQTGYSPDAGPAKGKIAWRVPKGNFWYATPVIENGKVYTAAPGADVMAYCLDEITGDVIWNGRQFGADIYQTPGSIFSPVVSSNKVLFTTGWWQAAKHIVLHENTGVIESQLAAGDTAGGGTSQLMVYKYNRWNVILADATTGKGVWQFESGGNLSGEPLLADNKIYVARQSGRVYCFDTSSRNPLWQRDLGVNLRGTPGVSSTRVYVGDTNRKIHALNNADGSIAWNYQTIVAETENKAYQYFSTAVEADIPSLPHSNRVYVGAASGYVYCLNATNGNLIWKYQVSDWVRSKPVVLGDAIYVATLDARLFALRDTGTSATELWQTQLGEHGFTADLVGNANGILASGMDLVLYSVSPTTGHIQWRHSMIDAAWIDGKRYHADVYAGQYQTSPVVVNDVVYIGGPDGFLNAHNVDTGRRLWRFETRGRISATPRVADGKVFIGQNARYNEYYAIDQNTGEPIWKIDDLGWTSVGATGYHNDQIFVGTVSGWLYAIDASSGRINWKYQDGTAGSGFYPHPATDATRVYTGSHDGHYYAFNQTDGSVAWSVDTSNNPGSSSGGGNPDSAGMVLWQDHVYVQKRGSRIAALDRDTGDQIWEWQQPANYLQNGTVAVHDNKLFGSVVRQVTTLPYIARIYAFDDVEHGGKELWSYDEGGGGGGLTAPVVANGKLIFGSSAGVYMTCVNPDNGALIWRCFVGGPMEEGVPALYGNKVFSHHRNGYFFAIE